MACDTLGLDKEWLLKTWQDSYGRGRPLADILEELGLAV